MSRNAPYSANSKGWRRQLLCRRLAMNSDLLTGWEKRFVYTCVVNRVQEFSAKQVAILDQMNRKTGGCGYEADLFASGGLKEFIDRIKRELEKLTGVHATPSVA